MGKAFIFKGKALCDECYQKEIDFAIHAAEEVPSKKAVDVHECDQCHVIIEPEEEL